MNPERAEAWNMIFERFALVWPFFLGANDDINAQRMVVWDQSLSSYSTQDLLYGAQHLLGHQTSERQPTPGDLRNAIRAMRLASAQGEPVRKLQPIELPGHVTRALAEKWKP